MDDLVELGDLLYDPSDFWPELVLYTSLILRGYDLIFPEHITGVGGHTETEWRNHRAKTLIDWLEPTTRSALGRDTYLTDKLCWINDRLPDVCGSCFFSFGLTVSGRYRFSCPECKGKETGIDDKPFRLKMELHRYCMHGSINEALLVQLIYKYYSPNGDATWVLIPYNPLI